jgi:hypothetical protein
VHAVADQQDRVLGRAHQPRRFGDLTRPGALVDQAIRAGGQGFWDVELFGDHVRRIFDVSRAGGCRHRATDRLANDFVRLVGVFD